MQDRDSTAGSDGEILLFLVADSRLQHEVGVPRFALAFLDENDSIRSIKSEIIDAPDHIFTHDQFFPLHIENGQVRNPVRISKAANTLRAIQHRTRVEVENCICTISGRCFKCYMILLCNKYMDCENSQLIPLSKSLICNIIHSRRKL